MSHGSTGVPVSRTRHRERESKRRGSARFGMSCRNHGGCGYCLGNRLHSSRRRAGIGVPSERPVSRADLVRDWIEELAPEE